VNNKCVYLHKLNGEVVYVGSGCKLRASKKTCRSMEHLSVWDDLEIDIIHENLSTAESIKLEQDLIDKHWNSGKLFNKNKTVHAVKQISLEELDEVLSYDESSSTFLRWKVSNSRKVKAGDPAGCIGNHGYAQVKFKGKFYQAHRIVLVLNNKEDIPEGMVVDHIDGNKANNLLSNLRVVSQSDNSKNKTHNKSNTGYQGITERANRRNFVVSFTDSKHIYTNFSYTDKPRKSSKNHYPTREQALAAALAYRDTLVIQGKITITNKDELNGIN
jgi:HNH endonuclease